MYTSMMRKAMLGDTATLNLDFSAGTLPTAVTFTRADSTARATFIDASGYVKTVTAAGDPRFDYTGGVAKGLLIEASATNLTTYSQNIENAAWDKNASVGSTNADVTTVSAATPANGTTVNQIVFNRIVGGFSRVTRSSTGTASTPYTMSVWMRTVSGTANVGLRIGSDSAGFKCAVTTTWQRFQYTYTLSGTSSDAQIMLWENIVGTDLTATVYAWGCQVEAGSSASSYIPTAASALTRLADDAVIRSTAWTSLYAQPGAMVVEFYRGAYGAGDRSIRSTDPTAARHWHLKNANASATAQIAFSTGSPVTQTGLTAGLNKVAIAWNAPTPTASFDLCVNGASPTFGGSNVGTTLSTWLTLGSQSTTGVSGTGVWDGYLNNSIKSVKYYTGLTYAEMQAKTT